MNQRPVGNVHNSMRDLTNAERARAGVSVIVTTMRTGIAALLGLVALAAGGCASGQSPSPAAQSTRQVAAPATGAARSSSVRAAAASYLAIAEPANHRLDEETGSYAKDVHRNLAAARSDLLAEAATERWFDQRLTLISLPPPIAATARAMILANQRRISLTEQQARSMTRAEMASFSSPHKAADAAVEAQSRIIRRQLGLPPPPES